MALGRRLALISLVLAGLALALAGCTDPGGGAPEGLVRVDITDKAGEKHTFFLEAALDNDTRFTGLSDREFIDEDGGMIFVFRRPEVRKFVMRDCPIEIDILYIDARGSIIAQHAMVPEEPQREGESDRDYDMRLKRYSSRFATDVVIELKGGTLERLGVEEGDVVKVFDLEGLKARAE